MAGRDRNAFRGEGDALRRNGTALRNGGKYHGRYLVVTLLLQHLTSSQTFPIKKSGSSLRVARREYSKTIKLSRTSPFWKIRIAVSSRIRISGRAAFEFGYLCPPDGFDIPSIV